LTDNLTNRSEEETHIQKLVKISSSLFAASETSSLISNTVDGFAENENEAQEFQHDLAVFVFVKPARQLPVSI
jgi:hypothetical protein